MSASSEENRAGERQAEIGPPPYYHRSDCNICRKQDGLNTGSQLLDYPPPGGYIVQGEHFLVEHAPLLHRLVPAIKAATGVQRVYFLALMERAPHFHLWLVPKENVGELRESRTWLSSRRYRPRTTRLKRWRDRSVSLSSSPDREQPGHLVSRLLALSPGWHPYAPARRLLVESAPGR